METRQLIIESAFIAFIDHGYDRVSLNQIIKSTGLTKGAFYHYFSSKDELIKEVMSNYFFSHLQQTIQHVGSEDQSFQERLDAVFKNVMNVDIKLYSQPNRNIERNDFLKLLFDSMNFNTFMKEMNDFYHEKIVTVMADVLESGKKEGSVKEDIVSEEIAGVFAATVRGTIMITSHMSKEESEKELRTNVGAIMKLIEKK